MMLDQIVYVSCKLNHGCECGAKAPAIVTAVQARLAAAPQTCFVPAVWKCAEYVDCTDTAHMMHPANKWKGDNGSINAQPLTAQGNS